MPARDIYHDTVKNALIKDGWMVTDDPFKLKFGFRELFVDLAVKKLISAQKDDRLILVEIKSFTNPSAIADLEQALGQYIVYSNVLEEQGSTAILYSLSQSDKVQQANIPLDSRLRGNDIICTSPDLETLYMAIRYDTYCNIFSEPIGRLITQKNDVKLLIFNPEKEEIVEWKP